MINKKTLPTNYSSMMMLIIWFLALRHRFARSLRHCANYAANYITFCPSQL